MKRRHKGSRIKKECISKHIYIFIYCTYDVVGSSVATCAIVCKTEENIPIPRLLRYILVFEVRMSTTRHAFFILFLVHKTRSHLLRVRESLNIYYCTKLHLYIYYFYIRREIFLSIYITRLKSEIRRRTLE